MSEHNGYPVRSWVPLNWILGFDWLGPQRVAPIDRQRLLTQSLERCHFQLDPLFLESLNHKMSLSVTKIF